MSADGPAREHRSWLGSTKWMVLASFVGVLIGLTLAGGGLQHLRSLVGTDSSVRLTEPDTLQGFPRVSDPVVLNELSAVKASYGRDVESVVAAYGDPRDPQLMVHVVAANLSNPRTNLDRLLTDTTGTTPREVVPVEPGPLGGIAQCGVADIDLGTVAVCAWVADNSFGKFIWAGASLHDASREFVSIRDQLER